MPRVQNGPATKSRRKRIVKLASGYYGNKSRLFRYAKDAVWRAGKYAYRDRRKKKSDFRSLWIVRINAACRDQGISYSRFIAGLKVLNIEMNRKSLSELAIHDITAFNAIVARAKAALPLIFAGEKA